MSCVAMERLLKYANCTEETMQAKENTWDELFRDGRKKLEIDLTTLKTGLNRRGHLQGRLVIPHMRKMDYKLDNYNDSMMIKLDSCLQTFSNHIHVRCIKFMSHLTVMSPLCPACV